MGRHRTAMGNLGWDARNSPNPWKQGSAKRVVRTLDYSAAEIEDVPTEPLMEARNAPSGLQEPHLDDRLQQLQQDGAPSGARAAERLAARTRRGSRAMRAPGARSCSDARATALSPAPRSLSPVAARQRRSRSPPARQNPRAV